jgi:NAD(P) transhydrogenase
MTEVYDLVAIGSGPAGESAAELAAFYGHRAVDIEKNRPGGTVTTTGGAPTKTLREAALYLTGFRDRDGLRLAAAPDIVLPTIRKRTRDVSGLLQRVTADNIAKHHVDYLQGNARLGPGRTLMVMTPDGREFTLRPKAILIASGSRPKSIPFDDPGVCDSDTILALGQIPQDILIVGGGPVGVEYATICHALGARVTLAHMADRLMPMMDGEMSRRMDELFSDVACPRRERRDNLWD